ncbi:acyltransferase family protein [Hymenobacter crusticola]|uniref:Acyltransferase 3 domain-containing protein n=1 Tax=Hymenobacter crusticola TaxID=1770526 RepID=A0A243W7Z9_9BACT|nr:acyltransferase [Hymenobacter crusticola]OUJ71199.1 hypothetical protein BXP70_22215 [Hymenobacter crusticola]
MSDSTPRVLSGAASILLDSLRLGAALIVFYRHALVMWYPAMAHPIGQPGDIAHAAVVVFFVLSGYVIAHTTAGNNRGPLQYAQARLSRLCSVVLPALVFTAVIQVLLLWLSPALVAEYSRGLAWPRYLLTAGFLNEVWFLSAAPPLNEALWSLSFEFWYYVIFGLWFYRRAGFRGLLLPACACLIAGPKILVMMPVWLVGVVAYRLPRPQLPALTAWLLVAGSLCAAGAMVVYLLPLPYGLGRVPWFFASQFLTDWVVGLCMAVALWMLPSPRSSKAAPKWIGQFRQVADLTFPIYVLHFPLLVLWRALFAQHLYDATQLAQALGTVLILAAIIGVLLEKQRTVWVRFFQGLLQHQQRKIYLKRLALQLELSPKIQ